MRALTPPWPGRPPQDEQLQLEDFGFLKLREYSEVEHMMELGYRFAEKLELNGAFEMLTPTIPTGSS